MNATKALTKRQLVKALKKLDGWQLNKNGDCLAKTFKIDNYIDGLVLAARTMVHAEVLNHHPEINISYGKVRMKLTTHETKAVTRKDVALAIRVDNLKV